MQGIVTAIKAARLMDHLPAPVNVEHHHEITFRHATVEIQLSPALATEDIKGDAGCGRTTLKFKYTILYICHLHICLLNLLSTEKIISAPATIKPLHYSMGYINIQNTRLGHSFILILSLCHVIEEILIPRLVDETTQFTIRELE